MCVLDRTSFTGFSYSMFTMGIATGPFFGGAYNALVQQHLSLSLPTYLRCEVYF